MTKVLVNKFTVGELDPKMINRVDAEMYYSAVEEGLNVTGLTQGGFTKRQGSLFIAELSDLTNKKLIDFEFNVNQISLLVVSVGKVEIYTNDVLEQTLTDTDLTSDIIENLQWVQSADTLLLFHEDLPTKVILRGGVASWTIGDASFENTPYYNYNPSVTEPATTLTPSAEKGYITLTAGSSVFLSTDVGQLIDSVDTLGRVRIAEYVSGTVVKGNVVIEFSSKNAISSGDWTIDRGYEPLWSATRGYASNGIFHENRLWLGGFKSLPNYLVGSVTNNYFDFDEGTAYADEAIVYPLESNQLNKILNFCSQRVLITLTAGSEWGNVNAVTEGITPDNVRFLSSTNYGSKEGLKLYEEEGFAIFVQRGGKNVLGLYFDDSTQNFKTQSLMIYNSHLLNNPQCVALRKPTSTEEAAQYYVINEDGSLIIGTLYISQKVGSFFKQETDGEYKQIVSLGSDIYCIVRRTIDGTEYDYLEKFGDYQLDSAYYTETPPASTTITGLDYLEGKTVKVRADGSVLGDEIVNGGEITIDRIATSTLEIGLIFTPYIKTLPINVAGGQPAFGDKKRIHRVDLGLYETGDIIVNINNRCSFRGFGPTGSGSPLDEAPPSYTGNKRISGILGWDKLGQIEITQEYPMPLTVLAMSIEVKGI